MDRSLPDWQSILLRLISILLPGLPQQMVDRRDRFLSSWHCRKRGPWVLHLRKTKPVGARPSEKRSQPQLNRMPRWRRQQAGMETTTSGSRRSLSSLRQAASEFAFWCPLAGPTQRGLSTAAPLVATRTSAAQPTRPRDPGWESARQRRGSLLSPRPATKANARPCERPEERSRRLPRARRQRSCGSKCLRPF